MRWPWLRPRFGLRALLVLVTLCAVGAWFYANRPEQMRAYRNHQARLRINPYELSIAGQGDARQVPAELVAILGDSRLKHWHQIGAVKFLVGNQLATTGRDSRIRIWNTHTGRQLHDLPGQSLTVSGDRKQAFFAGTDSIVRCWDVAQAKVTKTLGAPAMVDWVSLATDLHGNVLAVETSQRSSSREITLWDVAKGREIHRFRPPKPGGGALAVSSDGQFFTWENESQVQVARTNSGEIVHQLGPIRSEGDSRSRCSLGQVMFSPDDGKLFVGSALGKLTVFDLATGAELWRIGAGGSSIHQFALGPRAESVIPAGQGSLREWHQWLDEWTSWRSAETPGGLRNVDWHESVVAGSTPSGVAMWRDWPDFTPWRLDGGPTTAIRRLVFHPNGKHLLTGDADGSVAVWEIGSWRLVRRWQAHARGIESLAIAASGSRLVTAAADQVAAVWDPLTGDEVCLIRGILKPGSVSISPDGKQIVAVPRSQLFGDQFEVSDAETGASLQLVGPVKLGIMSPPAWSADGSRVAFIDQTQSLQVFDSIAWKHIAAVGHTQYGQQEVVAAWFADNRRLISTNWAKDEVHLLEIGKSKPVLTLNAGGGQAQGVALHPSEEWIAVCGEEIPVQLWHLPTSKLVKSWQLGPPAGVVSQVAFSPDGHYLATVNGNGTVYVLSLDGVLD